MEFLAEHWLSAGTAAFLIAMVLYGHYRGFLRLAVSMTALILTLVVVHAAMPYVTDFLRENTAVKQFAEQSLLNVAGLEAAEEEEMQLPSAQRLLIEKLHLPDQVKESLIENNNHEVYRLLGVDAFVDYIGAYLANMIFNLIGSILLFIVVFIAIRLIIRWLDLIAKLPLLNGMNQIAGALLGGLQGLLIIWVFFLIVTACSATAWGNVVLSQIESSPWLLFLYKNNIFNWLISGILNSFA